MSMWIPPVDGENQVVQVAQWFVGWTVPEVRPSGWTTLTIYTFKYINKLM